MLKNKQQLREYEKKKNLLMESVTTQGKADNIYTDGVGCYRWYQTHALAGSAGPTHEDACVRKGSGLW